MSNFSLFNITINNSFLIEPQLMDFIIISFIIIVLGIIAVLIIAVAKEYRNDKLIKKSLMSKIILLGIFYLLIGYLLVCFFLSIFLLNKYAQVVTPVLPIIIMITYQCYQRKNEEIIFKKVLENYTNKRAKGAVKHLKEKYAKYVEKIDKYLYESREFYYILDTINNDIKYNKNAKSISEYSKTTHKNNYIYLISLIRKGAKRADFRASAPRGYSSEKENEFRRAYRLVELLILNQKGAKNVFDRHMDKFIKNEKLFQAYEKYRTYGLGDSLKNDYEESIKLMNNIISKTEKYLQEW